MLTYATHLADKAHNQAGKGWLTQRFYVAFHHFQLHLEIKIRNITGGILQDEGDAMIQILTDLFNTSLHHRQVHKAWKNALIVLIQKKGNT